MLHLLIVDDEKTTRDSLKELVPWIELGITNVTVAKNGLEAFQLAQDVKPDIILTDVRMPKMDGIELARLIRNLYPDCKIIFLSGYADKDYLKSAIQLKAIRYIEKPINPEEIETVMRETIEVCHQESQMNSAIADLKNSIAGSKPLIRQEIALELIKGVPAISKLTEQYGEFAFNILVGSCFTVANILFNWKTEITFEKITSFKQVLLQLLSGDTLGSIADLLAGFENRNNLVLIYPGKIDPDQPGKNIIETMLDKLLEISDNDFSFSIGVGHCANSLYEIPDSYRTALEAANRQFYSGPNQVFYYNRSIDCSPVKIERHLFSSFKDYLSKDNQNAAKSLVKDLTGSVWISRDHDINRVKNIYFHLLLIIYEFALERELIDPFGAKEQGYIWQEIEEQRCLSQLSEYVLWCIQTIFSRPDEKDAVNRKAHEIMRYIRENCGNKELSIQSISSHVYLSPTYLCAFFKKTIGKTLNEYITEVRMEKAKELLKGNKIKLYEVATGIGLTDVNYFSTLFKKCVGCTPSEFREKYYR